jgi:pilus assembly protein Flp/PilA
VLIEDDKMKKIMNAMNRDWADDLLRMQVGLQTEVPSLGRRLIGRRRVQGATLVEYGIMVALIAALSIALIATIGEEIQVAFQTIVTALTE